MNEYEAASLAILLFLGSCVVVGPTSAVLAFLIALGIYRIT